MAQPWKQHVLSQVLQRRWARPPHKLIAVIDVFTGRVNDTRGAGGAGWEKDFIRHDPDAAEQRWKTVEDDLPTAFALLDGGEVTLPDPQADLIRDCIALHWARSRVMRTAVQQIQDVQKTAHLRQHDRPDILDALFFEVTRLHSAGPEGRQIARDLIAEGPPEFRDGRYFAERVRDFFERSRNMFRRFSIQIVDAPIGWEYVLGDAPVLTVCGDGRGLGPHQGVALGDAELVIMPLGPRVAVSLDPHRATRGTATPQQVRMINKWQVDAAEQQVIFRPGSPAAPAVRRWVEARPPTAARRRA